MISSYQLTITASGSCFSHTVAAVLADFAGLADTSRRLQNTQFFIAHCPAIHPVYSGSPLSRLAPQSMGAK